MPSMPALSQDAKLEAPSFLQPWCLSRTFLVPRRFGQVAPQSCVENPREPHLKLAEIYSPADPAVRVQAEGQARGR